MVVGADDAVAGGESVTGSSAPDDALFTVDSSVWVNSSGLRVTIDASCTGLSSVRLIGACISGSTEEEEDNKDGDGSTMLLLLPAASGLMAAGAAADVSES